jgi:hypothetical protein
MTVRAPWAFERPLAVNPSVVAAFDDLVHLLAAEAADVSAPQVSGQRIEAEAPWIAQPGGPELGPEVERINRQPVECGRSYKGIVLRNRIPRDARVEFDRG